MSYTKCTEKIKKIAVNVSSHLFDFLLFILCILVLIFIESIHAIMDINYYDMCKHELIQNIKISKPLRRNHCFTPIWGRSIPVIHEGFYCNIKCTMIYCFKTDVRTSRKYNALGMLVIKR